ncbi:class D sortase [Virgibacillus siamensis]|uniref:class D sortase n=1 Tax=Virgibacillus siamensis TaxID=480071 RepID=UPI000986F448|nr:class D sortase [Virgibacillus siamensis]
MRRLAVVVIITGIALVLIGGYQWFSSKKAQQETMHEARTLLNKKNPETNLPAFTFDKKKPFTNPPFTDRKGNSEPADSPDIDTTFEPEFGEIIGILLIPDLDAELPIVEGTDADDLEKGVGHYTGTAFPTQHNQIVLSGHRDTVFRRTGELEIGDLLIVQLPYGNYSYEITDTEVVDADDRTVIVPTAPQEVLTLTTCYPFSFIGNAPDRYIITALPVRKN